MVNYLHEIVKELEVDRVFSSIDCKINTVKKRFFRPAQLNIECKNETLEYLYNALENTNNLESKTQIQGEITKDLEICELNSVHTTCMDKLYNIETKYGLVFDSIITYRTLSSLYISICVRERKHEEFFSLRF
jgi:hypothetical protein